jgi:delta 1-pyrroline-5-carboxylate dehydrogenase
MSSTSATFYLNRKCTGAMVGAHPFGGFNMSSTDSESGGPDCLYLFTQAKSIGEKSCRERACPVSLRSRSDAEEMPRSGASLPENQNRNTIPVEIRGKLWFTLGCS